MTKFNITDTVYGDKYNKDLPSIFKISFGDTGKYYIHKGKNADDSVKSFLYAVNRGIIGEKCPPEYHLVVKYLKAYPAIQKVKVDVLFNGEPETILPKEATFLKSAYKDVNCLNDKKVKAYVPQWLEKATYKCKEGECITAGTIGRKKQQFKYCPVCGNRNP